jgi:uncharacterized NAD(P)/FAD-binding protein YdhS
MFKRIVASASRHFSITIYEKGPCLGCGMPYSASGAEEEYITNVFANEIPELVTTVAEWITTVSPSLLNKYHIDINKCNDYELLLRLSFGQYLTRQFNLYVNRQRPRD